MPFDYDLVIIGAGSGGIAAAERAAGYGVRVAIAEQAKVGGACINYGCIPEKLLDYAASYKQLDKLASSYGWDKVARHFHWSHFVDAKNRHLQHLNELHLHNLQHSGAKLIQGQAAFLDAHTVLIADRPVTADKILIAVGAKPLIPEIPGIECAITWRELYNLPAQPKHLAILGSDPIGVKVAGSMNELETHVTQIIAGDCVLAELDAEIGKRIQDKMIQQGVQIFSHSYVEKIERIGDRFCLKLSGKYTDSVIVDTVFVDAPRKPNLENLNLEQVGIQRTPSGAIQVDEFSRTTHVNVFAVGDCTDRIPLTPSAIAQARAFADTEFGGQPQMVSYDWVPISISSHPEAATVGLSEAQAREKYGDAVQCYRTQFRPLFYCLSQLNEKSLLKVVVNRDDAERILGVHMLGEGSVEMIQTLAIALSLGATKQNLDRAIGIHPSSAEELFSM